MRKRFLGAAAAGDDNVAIAKDPTHQTLIDGDRLDLVENKLNRAGVEDANLHHDALIGYGEIGALTLNVSGKQDDCADGKRYPCVVVAPCLVVQKPGDGCQDARSKQHRSGKEQPVKPRAVDDVFSREQGAVYVAHRSPAVIIVGGINYTAVGSCGMA